ncbi:MAG: hypothetical protein HY550_07160 [Elusimicrobia bacterium]|nr:hypothetical protein [Elusimicrobiota bacterium]
MTKSKKFWAAAALISLAVMAFAGYTLYGQMSLHFSGDTLEVRPVPVPVPEEEEGDLSSARAAALARMNQEDQEDAAEEAKAGRQASPGSETEKAKAIKTLFEYKDAKAKSVLLAGSFTSWKEKKLVKKDGVWRTEVYILPGTYPYHFTVDGKKKPDPDKPKTPTGDSLISVQ